jgi:hypothetical protein
VARRVNGMALNFALGLLAQKSAAANAPKDMGDLGNELLVLAYLILGSAMIVFLAYWALKKFGERKKVK